MIIHKNHLSTVMISGSIIIKESVRDLEKEFLFLQLMKECSYTPTPVKIVSKNCIEMHYVDGFIPEILSDNDFIALGHIKNFFNDFGKSAFEFLPFHSQEYIYNFTEKFFSLFHACKNKLDLENLNLDLLSNFLYKAIPSIGSVRRTLCHGDFHSGNIIISNGKSIVIDWEDCFYGAKYADSINAKSFESTIEHEISLLYRIFNSFLFLKDFMIYNLHKAFVSCYRTNFMYRLRKLEEDITNYVNKN